MGKKMTLDKWESLSMADKKKASKMMSPDEYDTLKKEIRESERGEASAGRAGDFEKTTEGKQYLNQLEDDVALREAGKDNPRKWVELLDGLAGLLIGATPRGAPRVKTPRSRAAQQMAAKRTTAPKQNRKPKGPGVMRQPKGEVPQVDVEPEIDVEPYETNRAGPRMPKNMSKGWLRDWEDSKEAREEEIAKERAEWARKEVEKLLDEIDETNRSKPAGEQMGLPVLPGKDSPHETNRSGPPNPFERKTSRGYPKTGRHEQERIDLYKYLLPKLDEWRKATDSQFRREQEKMAAHEEVVIRGRGPEGLEARKKAIAAHGDKWDELGPAERVGAILGQLAAKQASTAKTPEEKAEAKDFLDFKQKVIEEAKDVDSKEKRETMKEWITEVREWLGSGRKGQEPSLDKHMDAAKKRAEEQTKRLEAEKIRALAVEKENAEFLARIRAQRAAAEEAKATQAEWVGRFENLNKKDK